jgi:hypothetical protein
VPFVQVFVSPAEPGSVRRGALAVTPVTIAGVVAKELGCQTAEILVQIITSDEGSSPMVVALIRGRRRAHMARATDALSAFLADALQFDPSTVLVRFEPTDSLVGDP